MVNRIDFPLVKVTWIDACSSEAWVDPTETDFECPTISTVGFLIEESEQHIVLAMNYDQQNKNVSMTMSIPNFWIESVQELYL